MEVSKILKTTDTSEKKESRSCDEHGEYVSTIGTVAMLPGRIFETGCPSCEKAREWENIKIRQLAHADQERKRLEALIDRACIPPRFKDKSFEDFEATTADEAKALDVTYRYADNFEQVLKIGRSLIFYGGPGTGKTHLACAIANHIMKEWYSALFISVRGLVGEVKATWDYRNNKDRLSEKELLKSFIDVDLLILDEVGAQFESDTEKLIMFDVINGRYEQMKPTILLSNYPIKAPDGEPSIRTVLGDRVVDRLREGGGTQVKFEWESKRAEQEVAQCI